MLVESEYISTLVIDPGTTVPCKWEPLLGLGACVFIVEDEFIGQWRKWAKKRQACVLTWNGRKDNYISPVRGVVKEALEATDSHPFEALYVTSKQRDLREAVGTRIGTCLIGNPDLSLVVPDVFVTDLAACREALVDIQQGKHWGYVSELISCVGSRRRKAKSPWFLEGKVRDRPDLEDGVDLLILGRYFPTRDARHGRHPLSNRINRFKKGPDSILSRLIESFTGFAIQDLGVDLVTRVPLRLGSEGPDRVDSLGEAVSVAADGQGESDRVALGLLTSVKRQQSQKDAGSFPHRRDNVRGCFQARKVRRGAHVLLYDDVVTSGSTVAECASELLKAGAGRVIIAGIGLNQHIISTFGSPGPPTCELCAQPLALRFNRSNGTAFWGCPNYMTCGAKGIPFDHGLTAWNSLNTRDRIQAEIDVDF